MTIAIQQPGIARRSYASLVLGMGPTAYYVSPEGDLLRDLSGNGHDATRASGQMVPLPSPVAREGTPAVSLPVASRLAATTHADLSGFDDFTMLMFFRGVAWPTTITYAANVYSVAGDQRSWAMRWDTAAFRMALSNNGSSFSAQSNAMLSGDFVANHWFHVAWRRTGSTLHAWRNGQIVSTTTFSGTLHSATAPMAVGDRSDGPNGQLVFDFAHLAIFRRALSDAEIQTLYLAGRDGITQHRSQA